MYIHTPICKPFYFNLIHNAIDTIQVTSSFVSQGTNGAVSWVGLLCSFLGGTVVGLFYYIAVLNTVDTAVLQLAAPQWPIIVVAGFGGLFGSLLDSILGATLQYSGNAKYICGCPLTSFYSNLAPKRSIQYPISTGRRIVAGVR